MQPFERFRPEYISKLLSLGKRYLVSQSYARGAEKLATLPRISIIVSAYDNIGLAKTHLNAVREDRLSAIIDLQCAAHAQRFSSILSGERYVVYWAVVRSRAEVEKRVNARYKDHLRRYVERHTNWTIHRETTLRPSLQLVFGELYLNLRHQSQLIRIKFADIEQA